MAYVPQPPRNVPSRSIEYLEDFPLIYICIVISFENCPHYQYKLEAVPGWKFPTHYRQTRLKYLENLSCARCRINSVHPELEDNYEQLDKNALKKYEKEAVKNSVFMRDEQDAERFIDPYQWIFMEGLALGRIMQLEEPEISRIALKRAYEPECSNYGTAAAVAAKKILPGIYNQHVIEAQTLFAAFKRVQGITQGRMLQSDALWRSRRLLDGRSQDPVQNMSGTVRGGPGGGDGPVDPWYQPELADFEDPTTAWGLMPENEKLGRSMRNFEAELKQTGKHDDGWSGREIGMY